MRPSFLDAMSWEMAEVYGAITDQILINLAHYFPFYKPGASVPKSAFEYQAAMLAQMGQVNRDTIQIIKNGLKGAQTALNGVLEQSIIDAVKKAEPSLLSAVKRGILNPATNPIKVSPNQYHAFQLYYGQAAEKLNLVNTVMLESTKQAYQATVADIANRVQVTQTALDIGTGEVVTGVSSWNQALRHSIERMKQNGITGFIDHGGHRWSAEAYVAMDIRTTVYNTGRAAVWECNQDFGNDLYIVSYHDGARPGCYDWQNKVISSIDAARDVVDLDGNVVHAYAQSETTYGEPAGLFGINCKHYPSPWIPGVSVGYDPANIQDEAENKEVYEQTQEQRRLERKLREEKRDVLMAKAQGADDEEIKFLRDKARQTSADIQTFCDETGLPRRANREGVYTERSFPDASTYDVTQFESTQRDFIKNYFETAGGVQTDYVTGEMMKMNERKQKTFDEMYKEYTERQRQKEEQKRQRAEKKAAKAAEAAKSSETKKLTEDEVRKQALEKIADRIDEVERERIALIESGQSSFSMTDKLYAELERLEEKKKILEDGGWTVETATKTVERRTTGTGIVIEKADVYKMPDGTEFVFKHNMNKEHQTLDIDDLVTKWYQTPKELREKAQKTVHVVDRYNPEDSYWRKKYKNFSHSYMTGGTEITIYRHDYKHDIDYLYESLKHEMGHAVDRINAEGNTWFSSLQEWQEAMQKDKDYSGGIAESVSEYGKNSPSEDFAESVMKFVDSRSGFAAAFPSRAALLERLIFGGVSQ